MKRKGQANKSRSTHTERKDRNESANFTQEPQVFMK